MLSRVCLDVDASMLKLSFCSIYFHFIRESVLMNETQTVHVWSENIPADIAMKIIPSVNEARSFDFPSVVRHCGLDDCGRTVCSPSREGGFSAGY